MMRRYPTYRGSGVEWLGEVPEGWEVRKLGALAEELQTGPFGSQLQAQDYLSGGISVINPSNIREGKIVADPEVAVDAETAERLSTHTLRDGDLVLGRRGELGRCAVVRAVDSGMLCGTGSLRIRLIGNKALPDFFASIIGTSGVREWLSLQSVGSTMENLNASIVASIPVPVPPLPEQTAIAAFLDRETAKIDALVAEQRRLIDLLREKRQAVISHAVTKGLNPAAPMKPSGVDWLGDVPQGWEVVPVKFQISSIEQGWSPQCDSFPAVEGEWGVLKVGCVNGGEFRHTENKALPSDLEPRLELALRSGDILISRANTRELVGGAALVPADFSTLMICDKLYRLRARYDVIDPAYLVLGLSTPHARYEIELAASGASSSMLNIPQSAVLSMKLPLPPLTEQAAIVDFIRNETEKLGTLTATAETAIALLQERRAALISAAVTGKIDVRDLVATETEAA